MAFFGKSILVTYAWLRTMLLNPPFNISKALYGFIWIISIGLITHLLFVHFQIINFQYPLEYRENTDLWRAYLLSQGKNPYAYENLPSGHSQYGIIYPWLGSNFFPFTGINFFPLRLITFLAILPIIAIFIKYGIKQKLVLLTLFQISAIVYAAQLIHPGNFLAMPNTLGMAFFCISVLLPPLMRFNTSSLLIASVFSTLGFFTKLYFGLGGIYVLLYLLYNKEWRRFWILQISLLVATISSILIIIYKLPSFYELNIEVNAALTNWLPKFIWPQVRYFVKVFFGFMALLVAVRWFCPQNKIFSLKNPFVFGLTISSILLVKMGATSGQFFLYFQQLLLPFLVMICIEIIKSSAYQRVIAILLFGNLVYLYSIGIQKIDLVSVRNSFQTIENETSILDPKSINLLNGPLSYYAIKQGIIPSDAGQIEGLAYSKGLAHEKFVAQSDLIGKNIRAGKYTEIFVDEWQSAKIFHHDLLHECYYQSNVFEIIMYGQRNKTSLWLHKKMCE